MKLPKTLARLNAAIRFQGEIGRSTELVDMNVEFLRDDVGVFFRHTATMADGDKFSFDSRECSEELRRAIEQWPSH